MERRDFLSKLGIGAAFAVTTACLGSCKKEELVNVDFTLDLADSANSKLLTDGNYLVTNNVVVAKGVDGNYYATTVICSHEHEREVTYDKAKNEYLCTAHQARFDLQGNGLNGNGKKGLQIFNTELNGDQLRVFS